MIRTKVPDTPGQSFVRRQTTLGIESRSSRAPPNRSAAAVSAGRRISAHLHDVLRVDAAETGAETDNGEDRGGITR